jgi:hypothetical protein
MRGIERHQLAPRRLQNATSSPSVVIPSPFSFGHHPERDSGQLRSAMLFDRRAQMIGEDRRAVRDRELHERVEHPGEVSFHRTGGRRV